MSSFTRGAVVLLGFLWANGAWAEPPRRMFDRVVAVVDHEVILLSELDAAVRPFVAVMEKDVKDDVKREEGRAKLHREMLERLVERRLVLRVAAKKGVTASDSEIDQAIDSIAKQNGYTRARIIEEVGKTGMTEKEYRTEIGYQILEGRLVILFAQGKIESSDPRAQEKLTRARNEWVTSLRTEAYVEVRL